MGHTSHVGSRAATHISQRSLGLVPVALPALPLDGLGAVDEVPADESNRDGCYYANEPYDGLGLLGSYWHAKGKEQINEGNNYAPNNAGC
jgi:hypothetical protein